MPIPIPSENITIGIGTIVSIEIFKRKWKHFILILSSHYYFILTILWWVLQSEMCPKIGFVMQYYIMDATKSAVEKSLVKKDTE